MVAASSAYGYRRARPAALRCLLCVAAARAPQQGSTVQMGSAYSTKCDRPPLVRPTHLLAQDCPLGPRGEPSALCPQANRLDTNERLRRRSGA